MKRLNQLWKTVGVTLVALLTGSQMGLACEQGSFRDFSGATDVEFGSGTVYKYSVIADGKFQYVKFSATGGELGNTWNEGNTHYAEVRWTQNSADDPSKLKVYGEDKCGTMQDLRHFVKPAIGGSRGASKGIVRLFDQESGKGKSFVAAQSLEKLGNKWNDKIRSVWVGGGVTLILYENYEHKGRSVTLRGEGEGTMFNLSSYDFDKIASSLKVE